MISQRPLRRARAPLRPHERGQPRRRDPELGPLDHDAGRRERGSRRPARDAGRDRPRDDGRARHGRSAVARRGRQRRPRSVAAPPTCARCATPGSTRTRCRPTWSRRARARRRPARWCGARRRRTPTSRRCCRRSTEVVTITARVGEAKARRARPVALRRAARRIRAGRPLRAQSTRCSPSSRLSCPRCSQQVMARAARARRRCRSHGPFPVEAQRQLGLRADGARSASTSTTAGSTSARIRSAGGTADDVRITTRYDEDDFTRALMGVLHETGHALYERGPAGATGATSRSATRAAWCMHESQSLLMEMQACRSPRLRRLRRAAACARPSAAAARPGRPTTSTASTRGSSRGFIRVDADEVTYPAHVILRYRLERALLAGDLALADLPAAWNDGMQRAAGHRAARRLATAACRTSTGMTAPGAISRPIRWARWRRRSSSPLRARRDAGPARHRSARAISRRCWRWLRANVHGKGSLADTGTILSQATGAPLGTAAFKAHLETRYLSA